MVKQTGWDKFETALLIDACEKVSNGTPKQEIIKELSDKLRQRAIRSGQVINDLFLNQNGIALQMSKMDYLLTNGKKGLPGASHFFEKMVELKSQFPLEFNSILSCAQQQIEERSENANMSNKRSQFVDWINSQGKLKIHPNSVVSVLDECSEYAQKHGISKISFWDMEDVNTFVFACRKMSNNIHRIIKEGLDFPDYYGCNWSAFWDCLTDMVGEKIHIEIVGLEVLRQMYADTADKMLEILQEFKHYCDDRFADDIRIEIVNGNTRTIIE